MFNFRALPPLALYIHIPWCVQKCPYCDFNSHGLPDRTAANLPEDDYVIALLKDLDQDLASIWGRTVSSIFIGGGTPSLFSAQALDTLLSGLRMRLQIDPAAEITLEANPGTLEAGKFNEFRALGINRLSIGCQSFNDQHLRRLGRIHQGQEAQLAMESAVTAGFDNINLDLMFGLPGQTLDQATDDIKRAISLAPTHISHYQLTIEPNTLFHHSPPSLPSDDARWAIQEQCEQLLAEAGYQHYEISAHGKPGRHSQHNLNYWRFGDYLGIGAGAHAKITSAATQTIHRSMKLKQPKAYMAAVKDNNHISSSQIISRQDAVFEFMLNALRLRDGFSKKLFEAHTGLSIAAASQGLASAEQKGLITQDHLDVKPTQRGWHFLNDLLQLFI